jgi:hypothetical protein
MRTPIRSREAGFSLTELMVAGGILIIVVGAVMQSFVVQNRAYTVVDQVVEAQQNMRAIAWLLERDARMSGFMVPEAAALCGVDETATSDTIFLTDADAIDTDDQVRAALGAEVANYVAGTGLKTLNVDNVVLDGVGFYTTGVVPADFQEDAGVILIDVDDPGRGAACGVVDSVPSATRLVVDFVTSIPTPPLSHRVIAIPAHVYTVELPAGGGDPMLMRDGISIATDVEDLQIAYFFDVDRDGQMDAPELENPGSEAARINGVTYEPDDFDNRDLREITLNLVVRTREDDRDNDEGLFQATGNRAAAAATDGFRRRVHTSTIRLRNVGYRGVAL